MNAVISVVVPAYNSEKTIKKCLLSILNQTYKDLEVIVVNDGSSDSTEQLCRSIAANDNRVNIITIPNGGVSHARNVGIDNATGEFITFVDSDDYIDSDMYQILLSLFEWDIDIVHCSYKNVDKTGDVLSVVGSKKRHILLNCNEGVECLLSGNYFVGGLWNKIYRARLFKNIRLQENIKFNEDVLANYFLFKKANKTLYIDKPFYNYVAHDNSSTHSASSLISCKQGCDVSKTMMNESEGKPYFEAAKLRYLSNLLGLYGTYRMYSDKAEKSKYNELYAEIKSYKKDGYYQNKKDKLLIFMYRYMPSLYAMTYKVYDKIRVKKLDPEQ